MMKLGNQLLPGMVVWADLSPTQGREQSGRRPVLVVSSENYLSVVDTMAPTLCTDPPVMLAPGADREVVLVFLGEQHFLTAGAFDPQALGHRAAIGRVGVLDLGGEQFFKPTHEGFSLCGKLSLKRRQACSGVQGLADFHALAQHNLLTAKARREDWHNWAMYLGQARPSGQMTRQFEHMHRVLEATVEGQGVTLCPTSLLGSHLASGRLVCPLPELRMPLPDYYFAVAGAGSAQARLFVDWLVAQPVCLEQLP